jgi:hypothetical protein
MSIGQESEACESIYFHYTFQWFHFCWNPGLLAQVTSHPLATDLIIWGSCIVISKFIQDVSDYSLVLDEWNTVKKPKMNFSIFYIWGCFCARGSLVSYVGHRLCAKSDFTLSHLKHRWQPPMLDCRNLTKLLQGNVTCTLVSNKSAQWDS